MNIKPSELRSSKALSKSLDILKGFDQLAAIGLSGSCSRQDNDDLSDLDIGVFVSEQLPVPEVRKRRYKACGICDIAYFDVDFEVSRSDGLKVEGVDCGFIWMSLPQAKAFLNHLNDNLDCDEFLPGGLLTMKPLFDPDDVIEELKKSVPSYPENRAMHRIESNLNKVHFLIYVLAWLEKAVLRNDYFSFLKSEYEVMDNFFTAIFALNHQWYSDEKRLTHRIRSFDLVPRNVADRIESIIMHRNSNANLEKCLQDIKRLFADLATVSREKYPSLDLPIDWE